MPEFALITQWVLAVVLAVSAVAKLVDRSGTADAVVAFGLPTQLRRAAPLIPVAELVLAALLAVPATARWGAFGAVALLAIFSLAIAVNLARGRRPDCNCFGRISAGPIGGRTLIRNGVLIALAVIASDPNAAMPNELFSRTSTASVLAVVAGLAVAAVLAGLVWLVLALWQQQGRLLLRIDALEAGRAGDPTHSGGHHAPTNAGPPVGSPAPEVAGTDVSGADAVLSQHWSSGRHTLVVFGDPACQACAQLHPELAAWREEQPTRRDIVVVSRTAETSLPSGAVSFIEQDRAASVAYGVQGTPSAVLVEGDGTVASGLAEGTDAVRSLLSADTGPRRSAPVSFRPRPAKVGQVLPEMELRPVNGDRPNGGLNPNTVLVFWNEQCTHCRAMFDDLEGRSARSQADAPRLAFVVPSAGQAAAVTERMPTAITVVDREMRANLALGVPGTPSAALVSADHVLIEDLAVGPEAVLALFDVASN